MNFPKTVSEHWDNVAKLGCLITGNPWPTIHHVHGGSMKDYGYHSGMALRGISDALVIPLKADHHTGEYGIDGSMGVRTWEKYFGDQWNFIQEVSDCVGYDLIALHELWLENKPPKGKRKR